MRTCHNDGFHCSGKTNITAAIHKRTNFVMAEDSNSHLKI